MIESGYYLHALLYHVSYSCLVAILLHTLSFVDLRVDPIFLSVNSGYMPYVDSERVFSSCALSYFSTFYLKQRC